MDGIPLMQSSSRNGARVRLVVLHTTEGMMRAVALRDWKSWPGSSHASCDETGALLSGSRDGFVDYDRASWTLRSGNPISDNLEMCAWARWSRSEWLARPALLEAAARWVAERCRARNIPAVWLSAAQVRAGAAGVCGHIDWTLGMKDGTHTDPGPGFPRDVVMKRAQDLLGGQSKDTGITNPTTPGGFLMALTDDEQRRILKFVDDWGYLLPTVKGNTDLIPDMARATGEIRWGVLDPEQGLRVALSAVFARVSQGAGTGITPADIAAMIPADLARQVADELRDRLAA